MHEISGHQKRLDGSDEHGDPDGYRHTVEMPGPGPNGEQRSHQQGHKNGDVELEMLLNFRRIVIAHEFSRSKEIKNRKKKDPAQTHKVPTHPPTSSRLV